MTLAFIALMRRYNSACSFRVCCVLTLICFACDCKAFELVLGGLV